MTSVAIHQPNYLCWTPWWQKAVDADIFVILDHVQLNYRGYTRKVEIHGTTLTIPIKKQYKFSPIIDVEIDNTQPWRRKHTNAIHHIYSKYPRYEETSKQILSTYKMISTHLIQHNMRIIYTIRRLLGIKTKMIKSSTLNLETHGAELIREIIDLMGADTYITGASWKKYMNKKIVQGIKIKESTYRDTRPILDLIFNGEKLEKT